MRAAVCPAYHPSSSSSSNTESSLLQSTGRRLPHHLSGSDCSTPDVLYSRSREYVKEQPCATGQRPNTASRGRQEQELLHLGVQRTQEDTAAAGLSPAQVAEVVVTRRAQTSQVLPVLEARPAASQHSTGLLQEGEAHSTDPATQVVQIHEQGRVPDHLTGQVQEGCHTAGSSRTGPTPSLPTTTTRTGSSTFANNHMNELIGILRADVGELRSQGTSLAKQLWLLYVTFEDFMHIHHPKRATELLHSSLSSDNSWSKSTGNLAPGYTSAPQLAEKKSSANLPAPSAAPRDVAREVEVRLTSETDRSEPCTPGTMDKLVSGFSKISCLAEEDGDDVLGSRLLAPGDTYGDVTSPGTTSSGYETDQDYMTWQETRMRQGKLFMAALNDARSKKTLVRTGRHQQQTNSMSRDEYVIKADDLYHENYTSSSDNDSATYRRVRRVPLVSGHHENQYSGSPHLRQSKPSTQQPNMQTEPTLPGGNVSGTGLNGRRRADRIAAKSRRSSTEKNRLSDLNRSMQSIISDLGQEDEGTKPAECNDLDATLLTPRGGRGEMSLDSPETSPASGHWTPPGGHDNKLLMLAPRPTPQCDSPIGETSMSQDDSQRDVTYDPLRACGYEEEGEEEEEGEVGLHNPPPHRFPDHPPFYSPQHDELSARRRCADWQSHEQLPEMVRPIAHTAHGRVMALGHDGVHRIHEQSVIQERMPVLRRQESNHQDITGAHIPNKQASSSPYQYQHFSSGSISSDSGMASFATGEYSMDYDYGPWASPALHSTLLRQPPQEESIYETIPDHLVSSEQVCRSIETGRQRFSWSGRGTEQLPPGGLGSNYHQQHQRRPSIDSNATSHTYASIDAQLVTSISDDEGPPPPLLPARNYKRAHRISADDIRLAECQRPRSGPGNWVDRRRGRVRAPLHLDDMVKASDIMADTPGNHMYTVNDVLQSFERLAGHLPTEGEEVPPVRATTVHAAGAGSRSLHNYPQQTTPPPLPPAGYLHKSYSARMMHAPFHKSQPNLHTVQRQADKLSESLNEEPWYLQPCPLRAFTMSTPLHRPPPPPTQTLCNPQPWGSPREQALELRGTYC